MLHTATYTLVTILVLLRVRKLHLVQTLIMYAAPVLFCLLAAYIVRPVFDATRNTIQLLGGSS